MAQVYKLHIEPEELLMMIDALQEYRKHHKRVVTGGVIIDQYALYIDGVISKCKKLKDLIDATAAVKKALGEKERARKAYNKEIRITENSDDDDLPFVPDLPELPDLPL